MLGQDAGTQQLAKPDLLGALPPFRISTFLAFDLSGTNLPKYPFHKGSFTGHMPA